ncbi:PKD domain-containing protein [Ohtaekwangia sp.]|uniref:PKD domain-containing protein n=1 Tax=Ohtaekwangia sp. TaxID=2066019 RepID=UPI002FDE9819
MKRIYIYGYNMTPGISGILLFVLLFVVSACFHEVVIPVTIKINYEVKNNDYSIPVEITFDNLTTGAENYKWTFEGGQPATSDKKNPGTIYFAEAGDYKVTLEAWSEDDRQVKEIDLKLYGTVNVNFETSVAVNNISPVTVTVTNKTVGGTAYHWKFPNGEPSSFDGFTPPAVQYTLPGDHRISLVVENGSEVDSLSQVITVSPALSADFDIEPSFADEDYEAPLKATLVNNTTGGLAWQWSSTGGQISNTAAQQPVINFSTAGTYTVTLTAANGKETKSISKEIVVKPNSGLRTLTDIKLGINTAHGSIGSFYSTTLRRVVKANEPDSLYQYVDIAFFGLSASFTFNRFVSPDSVQHYTFNPITQPQTTYFINSLDKCDCGINFQEADFDAMVNDEPLKALDIQSTAKGLKPFDNTVLPRIVLFRTNDNRKGAIKIKEFHSDGLQSYILADIKVQKQ